MREYLSMAIGMVFVYFMLVIETIYGERNAQKVDKMIVNLMDWIDDLFDDQTGYSNAQSYEDIP